MNQNHDRDGDDPDKIPEESPPNNIPDQNEEQRMCFQQQLQHQQQHQQQSMQPDWSVQVPIGSPLTGHATLQPSPSLLVNPGHPALLQYYEAQMRDHAAAYASAAAAAAMTATQIAEDIASSGGSYHSHMHQYQPHAHQNIPGLQLYPNSVPMSPMSPMSATHNLMQNSGSSIPISSQPSHNGDNRHYYANKPPRSSEDNSNNSYHHRRRKRQQRVPPSNFNVSNNNANNNNNNDSPHQQFDNSRQHGPNREYLPDDDAGVATGTSTGTGTGGNWSQQGQQKRGRRRRRFWNDAGSSDSGDPSYNHCSNNSDGNYNRNRRRNRKMAKGASSSSDGGSASWITKKKQRQPNDESLLGKTGVSALYEWCMKRRTTPAFDMIPSANYNHKKDTEYSENEQQQQQQEESVDTKQQLPKAEESKRRQLELEHDFFETTVSIDGIEMGIGRGRTKTSAKHEASRQALLTLLPGVEFDEDSGILIRLPGTGTATKKSGAERHYSQESSHSFNSASAGRAQQKVAAVISLEDLAPNLAKQLAIGHSNSNDDNDKDNDNSDRRKEKGRSISELSPRDSRKRQKWPHVYPGTSTTSDDEDENSYYASRGAYVCSSLLHAMVQIDERLTEPPEFTYQVSAIISEPGEDHSKLKRKAGVPIKATSTDIPRGSFQCTGILKLQINYNSDSTRTDDADVGSFDESSRPRECYRLLRSFGVGGTKREARHTAAAKLLAMLFPECDGMAHVKQAAEAAREKYAASRALKQQSKREALFTAASRSKNHFPANNPNDGIAPNFMLAAVSKNTPVVPAIIQQGFFSALGDLIPKDAYEDNSSGCGNKINSIDTSKETGLVRQLSRQQQLEEKMDLALQKLNEHDDEGRSLPEELTADDVGRTVLRRARVDDIYWVEKLFGTKSAPANSADISPLFGTILASDKEPSSMSMRLWSSSTIVLLLCRAIAPHEDPPLGCAVLTLGFSMQKGKILRIAQIASKPHQPRERFIETLSEFAGNMGCSLISSPSKSSFTTLQKDCIKDILNPLLDSLKYPLRQEEARRSKMIHDNMQLSLPLEETLVKPSLQSVQEEGEGVEESDSSSPNDEKEKRREKPSKRSRFE